VRTVVVTSILQIRRATTARHPAMVAGTTAYVVAVQIRLLGYTIGHLVSRARTNQAATCPITQRLLASTPRRKTFQRTLPRMIS
jgi:hypothetical protein